MTIKRNAEVVVFERDCGATTGFSTQVSILPGTTRLPEERRQRFRLRYRSRESANWSWRRAAS
jgi:hypothetical protein